MPRVASDATLLRQCKSDLAAMKKERDQWKGLSDSYQIQLIARTDELKEWKMMFMKLLERTPKEPQ